MNWSARVASPLSALVVEPDDADRAFFVNALTAAGVEVIQASDFRTARAYLEAGTPPLLVTEIQLGSYNGLHLALVGRMMSPLMSLIVTSRCQDPFLQRCGEEFGAVFLRKPMTQRELFTALLLAALREPAARGAAPIWPPPDRDDRDCDIDPAGRETRGRGGKRRRRDMASFLLLEALRR